jgi:LmbE family N-acetylglucosaminyl deacetylase
MRRVAVSTHLDDVALSCFGVLGPETTVVTVLAGAPPVGVLGEWDRDGGAASSRERVLERRGEDCRALASTGCSIAHLDFLDGQYWGLDKLLPPTADELADALRPFLRDAEVFAPAGIHNPDHKLVRDAVLAVRPEATLYADLPYALHPDLGGFELPPEVPARTERRELRLDERSAAAKVEACLRYSTQLRQLTDFFGNFINSDALGLEVVWASR